MLFLALGLIIGISTIVILLSITQTMRKDIEKRLNRFGANIIMVPKSENLSLSYGDINFGGVNYQVKEFEEKSLSNIKKIKNYKNISVIAPKTLGSVVVNEKKVLVMGVIFEQEFALKTWWEKTGKLPKAKEELLLGASAALALNLKIGDSILLSGYPFTVSGVLQPTGASEDNAIIADIKAAQKVLGKPNKISMVEISAFCQGCPISELTLQLAEVLPNAKVTAMKQVVMSKMQSIEMFKSFSLGVSIIVIFIGSLLVMVTMMGSVNERTSEIGIFRAIGFRRGHIMQIILLEAMLLGIFGGITGVCTGNLIAWGIIPLVIKNGIFAGINYNLGALSVLISVALSLLASLYPAFKASSMDPTQALRAL